MPKSLSFLFYNLLGPNYSYQMDPDFVSQHRIISFNKVLFKMLKARTINSLIDIENIYKSILKRQTVNKNILTHLLLQSLVSIYEDENLIITENPNTNPTENERLIQEWHLRLTEFIKEIERDSPYGDLPDQERNIIIDLQKYVEINDAESGKRKITELASLIRSRNDQLSKIEKITKWSVPISVCGVILTLIFGIISLIQYFSSKVPPG